ncbi:PAS domain S-box protein [Deinococcus yunweiensis]|uniref:PAS domain S-box protein n=1 Tax=Deinococcus yunweiensis TaxID=367282 RepID=UPI00398F0F5A
MDGRFTDGDITALIPGLDVGLVAAVIVDVRQDDTPLVYVNPAFETLTGYPAATVLGQNCRFLQATDRDQPSRLALRRAVEARQPLTATIRNYRRDGSAFLNELTLTPLRDAADTVTHMLGFLTDVTATRRFEALLNRIPDPLLAFDREWVTTFANAAAAGTAGLAPIARVGQELLSTLPEAAGTLAFQAARRALETGVNQKVTTYSRRLNRDMETIAYPTEDGVAVLLRDVTAERQALLDLQASQERFQKIFQASPLAIIMTRLTDGKFVDANPAFLRLTGYDLEDLIGITSLELWANPADQAALLQMIREGRSIVDHHVTYRVRSGDISEATIAVVVVEIAGEPCIVTLLRDIRDERLAQRRLEASEQQARHSAEELQRTLNLSLDLITTIDAQGCFVRVNAASQRLLGYPPEALIGRAYLDFVHPDDRKRSIEGAATLQAVQELTTFQNRYVRRDGSVIWLDWTSVRLPDGLIYAIARDVTERRAVTEDLAFLAAIVRASTDAIIGLTLDGTVRSWNGGAELMYGYPAADMLGRKITEIVPPELLSEEQQLLARAARGEYTPAIETTRLSRTGIRIPVQLSIAPIFDSEGTVVGMSKIAQDISGRRESERQILQLNARLQRQLEHLTALREIEQAIASSLDLTVTLGVVLDNVRHQVMADAVTVLLLDPHQLTLNYAGTRGFVTASPQGHAVRLGEEVAGRVALTRQPVVLDDLRGIPMTLEWQGLLEREGLSAYAAVPLIARGRVLGVIEVLSHHPFDAGSGWLEILQTLAGQAAIAVDNAQLFLDLERGNFDLNLAYQETIEGWARALDLRDHETEGHSRRVTEQTVELCRALGVSSEHLVHVRRGALLHDIGKMGIADAILLKPGPLTDDEWVQMRRHPGYAVELLTPIQFLRPALDIPHHHHEKWDGSGYPAGLKGSAIPLTARAFAVVDVYDALTNDRPYRAAWPRERALAHLQAQAGTHFDPAVVQVFLTLLS